MCWLEKELLLMRFTSIYAVNAIDIFIIQC